MSTTDRTIRVFISSTFKDMQPERDALTKVVFPSLREKFKDLNIELLDIDLRWGISTEKADEETIAKCFQYIDECDPYFIGVLGRRYGGVPKSIPNEILEENTWLSNHKNKSYTELEILYSVFNPNRKVSDIHTHFFYFRKSNKKEEKPIYKLKQQLRIKAEKKEISLMDGYQNIDEFRKRVYRDLTQMIEAKYAKAGETDSLEGLKERQQAYIEKQTRFYFPSQKQIEFEKFVNGNERGIFVTGESGLGKSSFLANWIENSSGQLEAHTKIVHHFVGADLENASAPKIYQQLAREIGSLYGIEYERPSVKLSDAQRDFFEIVGNVPESEKLIIVVDGINQLESKEGAKSFLFNLSNLPSQVKIIVSATLEYERLAIQKNWIIFRLGLLDKDAKKKLIIEYFKKYKKNDIKSEFIERIASEEITSHPLYLTKLIEEIRIHNDMFTLGKKIDDYLRSKTAVELLERIIQRLEDDYSLKNNKDLVAHTLCSLYMTKYGMSVLDLRMAVDKNLPSIDWFPFFNNIQPYLIYSSGRYSLFHDGVREAVRNLYLLDQQVIMKYRRLIVNHYYEEAMQTKKWEHINALEVIYQLEHLKDGEFLYQCLSDVEFIKSAINTNDDAVSEAWDFVEENTNHKLINSYKHILQNVDKYDEIVCWKLAQLFISKGYYEEVLVLHPYIKTVLTTDRIKLTIDDIHKLIQKLLNSQQYKQAEGALITLSNLNKKVLSLKGICYCNKYLGITYQNLAKVIPSSKQVYLEMSLKAYKDEQRVLEILENDRELARCFSNQGTVLKELGQFENALLLKEEEEKVLISQNGNSQVQLAYCLNYQAILYMKLNQPEKAEQFIDRALRLLPGVNRINYVYLSKVNKLWKKENYKEHAQRFKLMEERLLREAKDYKELANCLNELARYVLYFQHRPFLAFFYTFEAVIYYRMYNNRKDLKHSISFINKMSSNYNTMIFSEILNELLNIPRKNLHDADFRDSYLTKVRSRIREISDEEIYDSLEVEHVDITIHDVESLLERMEKTKDPSLKIQVVNELESTASKIDSLEIKALIYEKITPYLSQTKSLKLIPVLVKWQETLSQLKMEEKLPECLLSLGLAYMSVDKKYLALKVFFHQQRISKKLRRHHQYFNGCISLANLLRSVGRKEAALLTLIDLRKYLNKNVHESERSAFYANFHHQIQRFLNDYYQFESVQKVTTQEKFLEYFSMQPAYKKIATQSLKAFILESVERYQEAANHYIQIGELYKSLGMEELIIPNLNKQIQLFSKANIPTIVMKKYRELIQDTDIATEKDKKIKSLNKAIMYAKQYCPEDVEFFTYILNNEYPDKQEDVSVITSIVSDFSEKVPPDIQGDNQVYRTDNMISLVDICMDQEDFLEPPCSYLIDEFVGFYKENVSFKEPLVVSKNNKLLYGLEVYLAAKKLNLIQVPVLYSSIEELSLNLIEKGRSHSLAKEYMKALHVLKSQQRLAKSSRDNIDALLHGAVIISTTYSFSGNIEKALTVYYDLYKYLEEITEVSLFVRVSKKCKEMCIRFYNKYQDQLDSNISPDESFKVLEEGSVYREIGQQLEEATYFIDSGKIQEALKKYEDFIVLCKGLQSENAVIEAINLQIRLLKRMNEYEVVFDKYFEILKWFREKRLKSKYEEYLIKAEGYFINCKQYRKGLVFYELKHEFYVLGEDLESITALEGKLVEIERNVTATEQEESVIVAENIEKINVPTTFRTPYPTKIEEKENYYIKHNEFSKPILCTSDFVLVDGYATYLAAKKLNLLVLPVKIIGTPISVRIKELLV